MTALAAPTRDRQCFRALDQAQAVRIPRAEFKRQLKAGRRSLQDAIREPEWFLLTMPICDLLVAAPRVGKVKRNRVLRRADVWPFREVGRLTVNQRERILRELGA